MLPWVALLTSICFATWAHINDPRWPATVTTTDILANRASFYIPVTATPSSPIYSIDPRRISSAAANMIIDNIINDGSSLFIPGAEVNTPPIEAYEPKAYSSPPEPASFGLFDLAIYIGALVLAAGFLQLARLWSPRPIAFAIDMTIENMWPYRDILPSDYEDSESPLRERLLEISRLHENLSMVINERDSARKMLTARDGELEHLRSEVDGLNHRIVEADALASQHKVEAVYLRNDAAVKETKLAEAQEGLTSYEDLVKKLHADLGTCTEERDLAGSKIAELEQKVLRLQCKLQDATPADEVDTGVEKPHEVPAPKVAIAVGSSSADPAPGSPTTEKGPAPEMLAEAEERVQDTQTEHTLEAPAESGDYDDQEQGSSDQLGYSAVLGLQEDEGMARDTDGQYNEPKKRPRGKRAGKLVKERQAAAIAAAAAEAAAQQAKDDDTSAVAARQDRDSAKDSNSTDQYPGGHNNGRGGSRGGSNRGTPDGRGQGRGRGGRVRGHGRGQRG